MTHETDHEAGDVGPARRKVAAPFATSPPQLGACPYPSAPTNPVRNSQTSVAPTHVTLPSPPDGLAEDSWPQQMSQHHLSRLKTHHQPQFGLCAMRLLSTSPDLSLLAPDTASRRAPWIVIWPHNGFISATGCTRERAARHRTCLAHYTARTDRSRTKPMKLSKSHVPVSRPLMCFVALLYVLIGQLTIMSCRAPLALGAFKLDRHGHVGCRRWRRDDRDWHAERRAERRAERQGFISCGRAVHRHLSFFLFRRACAFLAPV